MMLDSTIVDHQINNNMLYQRNFPPTCEVDYVIICI